MRCRSILLLALLVCVPVAAFAQSGHELDPVKISPDFYKLKFENEHVRVIEYEIEPGEVEKWHTHPTKLGYVISGGKLKITTEAGESFVVDEVAGDVRWMNAVGKHRGENVGDTTIKLVVVEVKAASQEKLELKSYLEKEGEAEQ